ncbi:MAG: hypothetical protein JOZ48_18415 [Acidobacteriaceae bacterium]|nr:hypothetical protein [Acidobacteriaceae bacterium]
MTFRLGSPWSVLLIIVGICARLPIQAAGVVNTCNEAALLSALGGGGAVTFDCDGTIVLTSAIPILTSTSIDGSGHRIVISGGGGVQIFTVPVGVSLTIKKLTLAHGFSATFGGAIFNEGTVVVSRGKFLENTATFLGGAIFNLGTLTVSTSTLSRNNAPDSGGGAILNDGIATITDSTFSHNSGNSGAAIDNSAGNLDVINCTFYRNTATDIGGGILNDDTTKVVNSTFAKNDALDGGGVDNDSGELTLLNSIVAKSAGGNCSGVVIHGGGNLSSDESCPGAHDEDPRLGPLQFNGGPTHTMALEAGSPAIDASIEAYCPATDQRGVPRPQGSRCDIGAYERALAPVSGTKCVTFYNGIFNGDITVSPGQTCGFVSGGVNGNVRVTGGKLILSRATVNGEVKIDGGGSFHVHPWTTITADFTVENIPKGSSHNRICGSNVEGDLRFHNNGVAVEIGSSTPSSCLGNLIGGELKISDNTAETSILDNLVFGSLLDFDNTALTRVVDNFVFDDLSCKDNTKIIGGPNIARHKHGQCF